MVSNQRLMAVIAAQAEIARLGLDLGGVMGVVAERTLALLDADGAVIELAEGDDMVYRAASGTAARSLGTRVGRRSSLSGLCVEQGELLRCDDSEIDPRVDRAACRRVGLRSMLVLPLMHDAHCVGVLKAMSNRPGKFSDEDEQVLGLVGDAVAAAMYHATRHAASDLFHLATHDPLTDLANRALFADRLNAAVSATHRQGESVGALMIDLDNFKPINDAYGHAYGDAVLTEVANRLRHCARTSDTVARIGGDEFALVLSPMEQAADMAPTIARFQACLAAPFEFRGMSLPLSASFGGAVALEEADNTIDLLELADQRMYTAKRAAKHANP